MYVCVHIPSLLSRFEKLPIRLIIATSCLSLVFYWNAIKEISSISLCFFGHGGASNNSGSDDSDGKRDAVEIHGTSQTLQNFSYKYFLQKYAILRLKAVALELSRRIGELIVLILN